MGAIHYLNQWWISPISMVSYVMTWHLRTWQRLFHEMDLCLTAMGNFVGNAQDMNSQNLSGNCTCKIISASPKIKWSTCMISAILPWYVSSCYCFIIILEYDGNKQSMRMRGLYQSLIFLFFVVNKPLNKHSMISDAVTLMWCQCNGVFIPKTALDCWYMSVTCWFYVPWHEWMAETPLKPH